MSTYHYTTIYHHTPSHTTSHTTTHNITHNNTQQWESTISFTVRVHGAESRSEGRRGKKAFPDSR